MAPTVTAGCTHKPQSFPQAACTKSVFPTYQALSNPPSQSLLAAKTNLDLGTDLAVRCQATCVRLCLVQSLRAYEPLTVSHVQAFPPEPCCAEIPQSPLGLQIPIIRRATQHFLNTVHITNTARRKGKQEFQLQATDRKEKKLLPFFFPWSKIQIQMPFSTRVLRHKD